MKKVTSLLVACTLVFANSNLHADGLETFKEETNKYWSEDGSSEDNSQDTQIASSMLAWGLGLFVAIAVVFGLVKTYQSNTN